MDYGPPPPPLAQTLFPHPVLILFGAMRQRILGSHTPPCHSVTGAWSSPHSVQCFALLHCSANQISAECCLAFATPGGYRKFLGCLGQLAPTTLPQRRLVSNLSLCGPLSLCASFSSPSQGGMFSSSPSQGGFSSSSPSQRVSLCPSLPLVSASSYPLTLFGGGV